MMMDYGKDYAVSYIVLEQIWMLRMQEIAFPGFKFQTFSGGVCPQTSLEIHAWYVGHMTIPH
jgi:hypothetical protein